MYTIDIVNTEAVQALSIYIEIIEVKFLVLFSTIILIY